jgi:hypothetical protein
MIDNLRQRTTCHDLSCRIGSNASVFLFHFCIFVPGTYPLWSFCIQGPALSESEGKWKTQVSKILSNPPWFSQRETSVLMNLSMAQLCVLCVWTSVVQTGPGAALGRWHLPGHICTFWICGTLSCHQVCRLQVWYCHSVGGRQATEELLSLKHSFHLSQSYDICFAQKLFPA